MADDPPGDGQRHGFLGDARAEDRIFVAADAPHHIHAAGGRAQHVAGLAQDVVTGDVAVGVVDLLEVVQVQHHEAAGAFGQADVGLVKKAAVVVQAGDRVLLGQAGHAVRQVAGLLDLLDQAAGVALPCRLLGVGQRLVAVAHHPILPLAGVHKGVAGVHIHQRRLAQLGVPHPQAAVHQPHILGQRHLLAPLVHNVEAAAAGLLHFHLQGLLHPFAAEIEFMLSGPDQNAVRRQPVHRTGQRLRRAHDQVILPKLPGDLAKIHDTLR